MNTLENLHYGNIDPHEHIVSNGTDKGEFLETVVRLENGVINLYNGIRSRVSSSYDLLLEESDIDDILQDKPNVYDENIADIVRAQAELFINDLINKLRELMIDLRTGKAVFVGGGSILLKKYIEASDKIGCPIFIEEISANTKGYELLYKAQG